jgi:Zn finger protein HypA/HybF involved in hydrogenase expression
MKGILIELTQNPNNCSNCSGYGIFESMDRSSNSKLKLAACPICNSIHPEVFGLKFINKNKMLRLIIKEK